MPRGQKVVTCGGDAIIVRILSRVKQRETHLRGFSSAAVLKVLLLWLLRLNMLRVLLFRVLCSQCFAIVIVKVIFMVDVCCFRCHRFAVVQGAVAARIAAVFKLACS